ncbi:Leucine-rich repeat serine/threonine-protein kinase 2 [Tulasnella sp. 425]|nr:Leucine-rich repeat serine/threonine-protein kinase 2 [Tulasnella sp. 425]
MEDEMDSAGNPRSTGSDPSDSRGGFKLSAKLRARMKKLEKWRIRPSSIRYLKDVPEVHGGHATVSKAIAVDNLRWSKSDIPREVLQFRRQSPESDDYIRGAADHRRDAEGEFGDEGKDDEKEHRSDSSSPWRGDLALRETEFLVELSHPNVVELKGFVEDLSKNIIWLVFSWADNGNLKDFVASRDWEIPERISLINDVAEGLEYLHTRKPPICHGDLKQPGLVQNQQQPVHAKFCTLSKTITLTGNIFTLRWAAPELLNEDHISIWSDIWALGWIAYERVSEADKVTLNKVLTNSIPFQDVPADAVVVERVIRGDLPSINEHARVSLFENLCSLMTMCWNTNPSERPMAKDYLHTVILMKRGRRGQKSGDSVMAFACFTEAHRICTKTGDRPGKADALNCLAELHLNREEYSEAIELYSEALQIHTDIGNMTGRASALWGLAEVHRLQNEYSDAIVLYSQVLQIRTDIGDRQGRAFALWGIVFVHRLLNESSEAIAVYSEVLQVRIDIGDGKCRADILSGLADALWGLAEVCRLRSEYSEAIGLYVEVLQIRTDIDDRKGRADALWRLADAHRLLNEYSEAVALYSEALRIYTDIGNTHGRAESLWGLAEVHRLRNEYSEAIKLYSEDLQIRTDIDDRQGRADALWGLADVHRLRNQYSEAIVLYLEALQIRTDIGDRQGRANALWGLAEVHRLQNEHREAIALYLEALQIHTDIGDRTGRADILRGLALTKPLKSEQDLILFY